MQNAWTRPDGAADPERSDPADLTPLEVGIGDGHSPSTGPPEGGAVDTHATGETGGDVPGEDEVHRTAVDTVDGLLDEVERALSRLDDGTYGRCEACGEPIDDGRLADLPVVTACARPGCAEPVEPVAPVRA
jgi:DnaK suppressor protein